MAKLVVAIKGDCVKVVKTRVRGGYLRVYLNRPWYSLSGKLQEILLAVVPSLVTPEQESKLSLKWSPEFVPVEE